MENNKQKAADIKAITKIFGQFKYDNQNDKGFAFEQIKSIFLILVKYWQPTETEYCCEFENWTKLNTKNRSENWSLRVNNIEISQYPYAEITRKEKLQQCVKCIENAQ